MNRLQSWTRRLWQRVRLAGVRPVAPGRPDDGLLALGRSGTELDKPWAALLKELGDARTAWQQNPLARRLVGLITAYVVGDGLALAADDRRLSQFLAAFWDHEQNRLGLRQYEWCDELSRSGELFITLHTNVADGMSYVRGLPASSIDRVETAPGDYERELAYHEAVGPDDPDYPAGRTWLAPWHPDAARPGPDGRHPPVCLHFAVNRPVGCVRGESDLAPVLPWLRRYNLWLEDRVRLNAAVHTFLWVVKVPASSLAAKSAAVARKPEPGTVMVIDRDNEEWEAVAPTLHANDAGADGRALRWMVAAGGPGIGLVDFGEADEANLATARAMAEQRSRFMRARQAYFAHVLATVAVTAYNRGVALGLAPGEARPVGAVRVTAPDISPDDNGELGASAQALASALQTVGQLGLAGDRWRRLVLRLVLKFAGESVADGELEEIIAAGGDGAGAGRGEEGGERRRREEDGGDEPGGRGRAGGGEESGRLGRAATPDEPGRAAGGEEAAAGRRPRAYGRPDGALGDWAGGRDLVRRPMSGLRPHREPHRPGGRSG